MDKKVILVVDDESNVRLLLRRMLATDYTVIEAKDGSKAVDLARKQKIDLILLDVMMPGIDGYTTCNTLKQDTKTSSIPVLMVTALGLDLNKRLAVRLRADGYVTKPFRSEDLLNTIRNTLAGKKQQHP